jgi:hypothetical protein
MNRRRRGVLRLWFNYPGLASHLMSDNPTIFDALPAFLESGPGPDDILVNNPCFPQRLIGRLLPLSHFIPLARHLAIAGLDLRIGHSGRSTLTLLRLLPVDIGSVRHDAFSGSALIQNRENVIGS